MPESLDSIILDVTKLYKNEISHIDTEDIDVTSKRFVTYGSHTWYRFLSEINNSDSDVFYVPFNAPTSHHITIGGSIAANTHSRMTTAGYGFMGDNITWFRLMTPSSKILRCSPESTNILERELYFAVPGSFGSLGIILDLEITVRVVSRNTRVGIRVLDSSREFEQNVITSRCGLYETLQKFGEKCIDNAKEGCIFKNGRIVKKNPYWDHGFACLIFGSNSVSIAHKIFSTEDECEEPGNDFSDAQVSTLFNSSTINAYIQAAGNWFPYIATMIQLLYLKCDSKFQVNLYDWIFFQNTHDDAHWIMRQDDFFTRFLRCIGFDPDLPVAHQTWMIPETVAKNAEKLKIFTRILHDLFVTYSMEKYCEFQDILFIPRSESNIMLMQNENGWYLYTISIVIPKLENEKLLPLVKKFYGELTTETMYLGVKVHLLKESFCEDSQLQDMHKEWIQHIKQLKSIVDPDNILSSELLKRLCI